MRFGRPVILILLALAGCGREEHAGAPATQAATSTSTSTTAPVSATQTASASPATLTIGGHAFTFTPAVLALRGQAPRLTGRLYSDGGDDAANTFCFDLDFELEEGAPLSQASAHYRTDDRERSDAPVGIFLPAEKLKLQAQELSVELGESDGGAVAVKLSGRFLVFPDDADVAVRSVQASGDFRCALRQGK